MIALAKIEMTPAAIGHSLQGRPSGKSSLHTEGASEYVQHHAAATLLDGAGYGRLDQPVKQQALIVHITWILPLPRETIACWPRIRS